MRMNVQFSLYAYEITTIDHTFSFQLRKLKLVRLPVLPLVELLSAAVIIWSLHECKYSCSKSLLCPVLTSLREERTDKGGK